MINEDLSRNAKVELNELVKAIKKIFFKWLIGVSMLVLILFLIVILSGCSAEEIEQMKQRQQELEKIINEIEVEMKISEEYELPENNLIGVEYLTTDDSRFENYQKIINDWIEENPDKTILNLANMPLQSGVQGVFIEYIKTPPDKKQRAVVYGSSTLCEMFDTEYTITNGAYIARIIKEKNISTFTVLNNHRGGVSWLIMIVEEETL